MKNAHIKKISQNIRIHTIFCIGRNYVKHAQELNHGIPDEPVVFLKPDTSVIFNKQKIKIPNFTKLVHHEVEFLVLIKQKGKNISKDDAKEFVAGYGIGIDVTARDIQKKAIDEGKPWSVAKGLDTFAPVSDFLLADEVDPLNAAITLKINDQVKQQGNTKDMLFSVYDLISYLSSRFTLMPGDLIFTGTPEGVGPLSQGDKLEASLNEGQMTLAVEVE